MTTLTAAPVAGAPVGTSRILRTARLHLVTPSVFLGIPWLITGSAWAVSMIIGALILSAGGEPDGMRYSWAVLSPQWYLVVVGVQAVTLTFPFSLGFGATRRDFWLGTVGLFVALSAVNAVAFTALVAIERATSGWWLGIHMFDALWYGISPWTDLLSTFSLQLFVFLIGSTIATIYMRWRMRGMLVTAAAGIVLLLVPTAILTWTSSWASVFTWFGTIGVGGFFGVLLIPSVVLIALGYGVIRGATPR